MFKIQMLHSGQTSVGRQLLSSNLISVLVPFVVTVVAQALLIAAVVVAVPVGPVSAAIATSVTLKKRKNAVHKLEKKYFIIFDFSDLTEILNK
jgi:hypothetical protein